MNNLINVTPDRLDDTANKVDELGSDYQRLYQSLYVEVDKLSSNWSGKDNNMFTSKIKGFEDDFKQIGTCISQYSDFLRASARGYREVQDELTSTASRLR